MDRGWDQLMAQPGGCRPDSKGQTGEPGEEENAKRWFLKKQQKTAEKEQRDWHPLPFPCLQRQIDPCLHGGEAAPSPAHVHHPDNLQQRCWQTGVLSPAGYRPPPAPDATPVNSPTATSDNWMLAGGRDGLESVVPGPAGTWPCLEGKALHSSCFLCLVRATAVQAEKPPL